MTACVGLGDHDTGRAGRGHLEERRIDFQGLCIGVGGDTSPSTGEEFERTEAETAHEALLQNLGCTSDGGVDIRKIERHRRRLKY